MRFFRPTTRLAVLLPITSVLLTSVFMTPALGAVSTVITTNAVAQLGPTFASPGTTSVPVLTFTLTNANPSDKLRSLRARWSGTAASPAPDLSAVKIFRETGVIAGSAFSPASDSLLRTVVPGGSSEVKLDVPDYAFLQTKLYIVADLASGATGGRTIDFKIEPNKINLRSGTWPPAAEAALWDPAGATVINTAPAAVGQSISTDEDVPLTISLAASDADGQASTLSVVTAPAHGTLSSIGAATCTGGTPNVCSAEVGYTPALHYVGNDSFTFRATDSLGVSGAPATISLAVGPGVNDFPVANADAATVGEDQPVSVAPLGNDTDPDGDALTISSSDTSSQQGGTVSCGASSCVYTGPSDFYGTDSFSYTAADGNGGTSSASVSVTVTPVNDAPAAGDDSYTLDEDTTLRIDELSSQADVLENDADVDGDAVWAVLETTPAHGTLSLSSDGTLVYTPDPDFNGSDSFSYRATDGTLSSVPATVTLDVTAVNDAPSCAPVALLTQEDTTGSAASSCSDVDGDTLTLQIAAAPSHGTAGTSGATLTYRPAANYNGLDTFSYRAGDGSALSPAADVAVSIEPVRDAPTAVADSMVVRHGTGTTTIGVLDNDARSIDDGLPILVTAVTQPSHGTAAIVGGGTGVSYAPTSGWTGADAFTYTISDGLETAVATVSTEVAPSVSFSAPETLSAPLVATFSEPVTGVSAETLTLRVAGTSEPLAATLRCADATGTVTPCTGSVTTATLTRTLVPGQRYTVSAIGDDGIRDAAGAELLPATISSTFRASLVEQEVSLGATHAWRTVSTPSAYGGSYTFHRSRGASASTVFSGTAVTWYTTTGPGHGKAAIYIDGARVATLDMYSATKRYRVARRFGGLSAGAHRITIVPTGTKRAASSSTKVSVDAFSAGGVLTKTPAARYRWPLLQSSQASGGSYASSSVGGSAMSFRFRGTGIRWERLVGPDHGIAAVYIDGVLRERVDSYAAARAIKSRSYGGLTDSLHTLRIVVLGRKRAASSGTRVSADRFVVS